MKGWNPWLVGFTAFLCLLFIILSIYGITKIVLYRYHPPSPEVFEEETVEILEEVEEDIPRYRVAIVIDDIGHSMDRAMELLDIDIPVSFAVIPFLTYSIDAAVEANKRGRDVLLHLPMEPKAYPDEDPGEGSLFVSMSDEEIMDHVTKGIEAVPYIVGVNNHMGSKFSEDRRGMAIVLTVVKERELFFLDSKTTAETTGYTLAREFGLKALERQVFLDNNQNIEDTLEQFEKLISIAKERGSAIAIGHPHPTTIAALREVVDRFAEEEVEVVPVSALLD